MEEKERYVIRYDLDYNQCLIDTEENQGVGDYIQIVKLLNQQDKEIKRLKANLKESENYIEEDEVSKREYYQKVDKNDRFKDKKIKELKQQLHDLPKKIIDEIEKSFTEYLPLKDKTGAGFYGQLNAILKKYGGENDL